MSGLYSNKFTLELGDVARLIFIDERPPPFVGGPSQTARSAEVVMTLDNLRALHKLLGEQLKKVQK